MSGPKLTIVLTLGIVAVLFSYIGLASQQLARASSDQKTLVAKRAAEMDKAFEEANRLLGGVRK